MFAFFILISALKSQLLLNEKTKETLVKIFPEGWGFFTKNPKDPEYKIYIIVKNKLQLLSLTNQSIENKFGFSRKSRMIGYEISTLLSDVQENEWIKDTTKNINTHLNDKIIKIKNKYKFKHLNTGTYIIKRCRPVPYAWAKQNQEINNPFTVVKIKILKSEN